MRKPNLLLYLWIALAAAAVVGMYAEVTAYFASRWFSQSLYYHCSAVPFIVAWLVWRQVGTIEERPRPEYGGLVLLCVAALVYLAGMRTGARFVTGLSFPLLLLGITASLLGRVYLRALWLPLALTAFMVAIPEHVLGIIAMPMQMFSTKMTGIITRLMGFQLAYSGVTLDLHGFKFIVAQECSGLNSLMALLLVGAVLVEMSGLPTCRKLIVLALIFPIVIVANIVRLVSVIWLAEFIGAQLAVGALLHGGSDLIVYLCAFMFVWLLIAALSPRSEDDGEEDWETGLQGKAAGV
jgi:exosortase